jgi:hypothetical protein
MLQASLRSLNFGSGTAVRGELADLLGFLT